MSLVPKEILKELGILDLPEPEQKSAIDRIGRTLFQAILVKSLDILSVEEEEELDRLLDQDETTVENVITFLRTKIPTFTKLLKDERNNLKESMLAVVS